MKKPAGVRHIYLPILILYRFIIRVTKTALGKTSLLCKDPLYFHFSNLNFEVVVIWQTCDLSSSSTPRPDTGGRWEERRIKRRGYIHIGSVDLGHLPGKFLVGWSSSDTDDTCDLCRITEKCFQILL